MGQARSAILEDRFPDYLREFFPRYFKGDKDGVPRWCVDALLSVGVDLRDVIREREDVKVKESE